MTVVTVLADTMIKGKTTKQIHTNPWADDVVKANITTGLADFKTLIFFRSLLQCHHDNHMDTEAIFQDILRTP